MTSDTPFRSTESLQSAQLISRRSFVGSGVLWGVAASLGMCNIQSATEPNSMNPRLFTFVGGNTGPWSVIKFKTVIGEPIQEPKKLDIINGTVPALPEGAQWLLRGVTSNVRYVERDEKAQLDSKQAPLGRPEATYGALIPIRKNAKWWSLTQNERRAIFEDRSHHTATGLKYLPSIARRLHHCRDLEGGEPFDFLTLFDYTKADSAAFEDLVEALRATEEWKFVEREIDIRLIRS
jgi:hypothetical protein